MPVIVTTEPDGGKTIAVDACPRGLTGEVVTIYALFGYQEAALAEGQAQLSRNHQRAGCSCLAAP